jgi:hypothetical protein
MLTKNRQKCQKNEKNSVRRVRFYSLHVEYVEEDPNVHASGKCTKSASKALSQKLETSCLAPRSARFATYIQP